MGRIEHFKQYAADCMHRAEGEATPEDKNILLNIALAWVRLAQQSEAAEQSDLPPVAAKPAAPGNGATAA
jgi:hypothetical protein